MCKEIEELQNQDDKNFDLGKAYDDMQEKRTRENLNKKYSKYRPSLIPVDALEDMSKVMTDGAKKYGDNNWMLVDIERYKDALMRHLIAYLRDPDGLDEESGHPHIAHLLTNAAILDYKFHHKGDPNEK